MALQKTITTKGLTATNAYHHIDAVRVAENSANINVRIFAAAEQVNNSMSLLEQKSYQVSGQDFTDYFATPHATKNVLARAQDYLKEKEAFYLDATLV